MRILNLAFSTAASQSDVMWEITFMYHEFLPIAVVILINPCLLVHAYHDKRKSIV